MLLSTKSSWHPVRWAVVFSLLVLGACGERKSQKSGERKGEDKGAQEPAQPIPAPESSEGVHHYRIGFDQRGRHLLQVQAFFPSEGDTLELMMPTWTPGSYLVREYARHVQDLRAQTPEGRVLPVQKVSKNRWRITTQGQASVVVEYKLFAREMSVRTNFVDSDLAVLNGASTFLTAVEHLDRPHLVELDLPEDWRGCVTGLPQVEHEGESAGKEAKEGKRADRALGSRFVASDFDQLVDSPLLCGSPTVHRFWALSKEYVFANSDESDGWDSDKSVRDLKRIVEEHVSFWGEAPYERYVFLNVNEGSGGGLEHKNSTLMMSRRFVTDERDDYLSWLGLVSHEFFHTWNVKRLRPKALGPFDYENENLTPDLWIAEGFTSYYGDLLLTRASVMNDDEYLEELSKTIDRVQNTPGRGVQSLSSASYDAWIKYYRPDDNAVNSGISYYAKGALVAFLLDAKIREHTRHKTSLDDVMRAAYKKFSGKEGFSSEAFRALASEVSGLDLSEFFRRYVDGTDELDYGPALSFYGLRFKPVEEESKPHADAGSDGDGDDEASTWLGIDLSDRGVVTRVRSDGPAAGQLNVDDELLAINGFRATPALVEQRLKHLRSGQKVTLLVSRRDKIREITVELDQAPDEKWEIEPHPKATMTAKHNRFLWLMDARRDEKK